MEQTEEMLLVQDTTSLDFSTHQETAGLGRLENMRMRRLFVHTTLAVSSEGVPLWAFERQVWARNSATLGEKRLSVGVRCARRATAAPALYHGL